MSEKWLRKIIANLYENANGRDDELAAAAENELDGILLEVEALRAENAQLREVGEGLLEFIKTLDMGGDWYQGNYPAVKAARAALSETE